MRHPVCTLSPLRAILAPFLPADEPTPAPEPPAACACGEPLDMEMEKDEGRCVNCAFEAAEAGYVAELRGLA